MQFLGLQPCEILNYKVYVKPGQLHYSNVSPRWFWWESLSHGIKTQPHHHFLCILGQAGRVFLLTSFWVIGSGKELENVHAHVLSHFSSVWLFATLWTVACQAPLSMGFSRQEHWSRLPCPSPGDLSDPGIEPCLPAAPAFQADSLPLSHWGSPSAF